MRPSDRRCSKGPRSPARWATYAAKVRSTSFRVTDSDIDQVRKAGVEEDAILEATLVSAVGAASAILERGLLALEAN